VYNKNFEEKLNIISCKSSKAAKDEWKREFLQIYL